MPRHKFRPRLFINPCSGYCGGPQWAGIANSHNGHGGLGCVRNTSLAEALADYCGWLKRMRAEIICRDGRIVRLGGR